MVRKEDIFPIGIGTWNIDCESIEKEISALMYSFSQGQNYLSLYMLYNHGEVVKKLKKLIDQVVGKIYLLQLIWNLQLRIPRMFLSNLIVI